MYKTFKTQNFSKKCRFCAQKAHFLQKKLAFASARAETSRMDNHITPTPTPLKYTCPVCRHQFAEPKYRHRGLSSLFFWLFVLQLVLTPFVGGLTGAVGMIPLLVVAFVLLIIAICLNGKCCPICGSAHYYETRFDAPIAPQSPMQTYNSAPQVATSAPQQTPSKNTGSDYMVIALLIFMAIVVVAAIILGAQQ